MPKESCEIMLENTFDLMCVISADGGFLGVNENICETLGCSIDELSDANFLHILHPEDVTSTMGALQLLKTGSKTVEFEARIRSTNGYLWMQWRCHVRDPKEGKIYTVAQNIDSAKRLEVELYQLRTFDERTGLLNRNKLFEQLDQLTADSRSGLLTFSLLMVSLEELRPVNDTFGHHVGDLLLKAFANRLKASSSKGMPVARFTGDQFAITIPSVDVKEIDDTVKALLDALTQPYSLDGLRCTIGASIGIESVTHAQHSAALLIRNSDKALQATRECGGRYNWYSHLEGSQPPRGDSTSLRQSA